MRPKCSRWTAKHADRTREDETRHLAGKIMRLEAYRCLKFGGRFSANAAMPSFWSSVANSG